MSDNGSETAPKLPNGKPFVKGYDPRRNLRGVPKDTIKGRALIRKIGAELIKISDLALGDYEITRAEAMIRLMYSSKAPADKKALIDALWPGLLKQEIDITTAGQKIVVKLAKGEDGS